MVTHANDRRDPDDQGGQKGHGHERDYSYSMLPYDDPAIINPDELATFPKMVNTDAYHHHYHQDHESHSVSKRTPVRDGRNITRTDNHPDKHGFM